ncbi:MAG: AtpZ/AtpI family protein [Acidimicrobiia bacterium]
MRLIPKPNMQKMSGDSSSNGAEMAGVVAVFLLIGLGLDSWLGTAPGFTLGLTLFAAVGQFLKLYFTYSARMKVLEVERRRASTGKPA